jgi:hypothetical protein
MPALRPGQSVVGDSAANWTALNPILPKAVIGIETDVGKGKVGNGVTAWNTLPYVILPTPTFTLGDATDVDTAGATSGNFLLYNGSSWEPGSVDFTGYVRADGTVPFTSIVGGVSGASNLTDLTTFMDVQELHYDIPLRKPVRCATTENINLTTVTEVDGVTLTLGDRVLVKDQTNKAENGIYVYADVPAPILEIVEDIALYEVWTTETCSWMDISPWCTEGTTNYPDDFLMMRYSSLVSANPVTTGQFDMISTTVIQYGPGGMNHCLTDDALWGIDA